MSTPKKKRRLTVSRIGTYVSIGFALYGGFGIAHQYRTAKSESDVLKLVDALARAAAVATGVAVLARELRGGTSDDILAG